MSRAKTRVLKFGGSVLHSHHDLPRVVEDIQGINSRGEKVVAVVSAYYGVTEELIRYAASQNLDQQSDAYARLVGSGEHTTARELTEYLNSCDIRACTLSPADISFTAVGNREAAVPVSIDESILHSFLDSHSVLVIPGFSAINDKGESVLLGRGGSDISAVCVAEALGLDSVRLLKDVDALYDKDPNQFADAQALPFVDYSTALELGGELIQAEAIAFAQSKQISIEVAAIGKPYGSRIGMEPLPVKAVAMP